MDPDEVERRIENVGRLFEDQVTEPEGIGVDCQLCTVLEATRRERIVNEATGDAKEVELCEPCWDKTERYTRGEDVDFSDKLRLLERGDA